MYYQLQNGKVVYLTIEEYLDLTDLDVQYLMSLDYGEFVVDPFTGSAVDAKQNKEYDFDYITTDDDESLGIPSDDVPFDDIIDMSNSLDI
jgi:hypothetical protein